MLNHLQLNIINNIRFLTQHAQQDTAFSIKKNDQLLQNIVKDIINFAEIKRSSDIHIEPQEDSIRIRFRIDGTLVLPRLCRHSYATFLS